MSIFYCEALFRGIFGCRQLIFEVLFQFPKLIHMVQENSVGFMESNGISYEILTTNNQNLLVVI